MSEKNIFDTAPASGASGDEASGGERKITLDSILREYDAKKVLQIIL